MGRRYRNRGGGLFDDFFGGDDGGDRESRRRFTWAQRHQLWMDSERVDRSLRELEGRVGREEFERQMGGSRRAVSREFREEARRRLHDEGQRDWMDDAIDWTIRHVKIHAKQLRRVWSNI